MKQNHLLKNTQINLGAYYTPKKYINIVWEWIKKYIDKNTVIFEPSCGYGEFLNNKIEVKKIGNDIDKEAIKIARKNFPDIQFFNLNILKNPNRSKFNISEKEKLIIIGNPPYNDLTSKAKKKTKKLNFQISEELKSRDIGISFLRMFNKLNPEIVCILHPLTYLIKKTNFHLLKEFKNNYKLIDGIIISSKEFHFTSKNSEFPIIIALYEKNKNGMNFDYIKQFRFKTITNKTFSLNDFDYINNYIDKYPKKNIKINEKEDIYFYTLRDINALKRNKTFLKSFISNYNTIKIDLKKLNYYIYVDVFKDFISYIPYYLRNLDIIIDNKLFQEYKDYFISYSLNKNLELDDLQKHYKNAKKFKQEENKIKIKEYFKKLLNEHFIENKN